MESITPEVNAARIAALEEGMCEIKVDMRDVRYRLMYRLPVWATVLLGLLTGIIGFLVRRG